MGGSDLGWKNRKCTSRRFFGASDLNKSQDKPKGHWKIRKSTKIPKTFTQYFIDDESLHLFFKLIFIKNDEWNLIRPLIPTNNWYIRSLCCVCTDPCN